MKFFSALLPRNHKVSLEKSQQQLDENFVDEDSFWRKGDSESASPPASSENSYIHLPSPHCRRSRGQKCPPYGAKSLMGHRLAQEDAWSHMPELVWIGLPDASSLPQDQDQQLQIPPRSSSSNGGSGATGTQHSALKTSWQETPPLSHVNGSDSTTTQHPASPPKQSISPSLSSAQARPSLQPPSFASNFSVRMGLKVPLLQKSLSGSRAAAAAAAAAPPPPPPGCMPVHYFAVFDGHGGDAVAKHCRKQLHTNLKVIFEKAWAEASAEDSKEKQRLSQLSQTQSSSQHQRLEQPPQQQQQQQQQQEQEQEQQERPQKGGKQPLPEQQPGDQHAQQVQQGEHTPQIEVQQGELKQKEVQQGKLKQQVEVQQERQQPGALRHDLQLSDQQQEQEQHLSDGPLQQQQQQQQQVEQQRDQTQQQEERQNRIEQQQQQLQLQLQEEQQQGSSAHTLPVSAIISNAADVQGKPFAAHPASVPVVDVDSAKTTEADVLEAELPQVGTPTDKSKAAAAAAAHSSHPSRPPPLPPATTLVTQSSSTSLSPVPDTAGTAHALLNADRTTEGSSVACPSSRPIDRASLPNRPSAAQSNYRNTFEPDVEACLIQAFIQTDQDVFHAKISRETGCTAVVLLTSEDHIWVANCGDSRAILCSSSETVCMSSDHKASRPDEIMRVEAAGGYVWWDRVMGELAVSRAIGDHCFVPYVIPDPEVICVPRDPSDQLMILATDGLWDVFTNEEVHALAWARFQRELGKGRPPPEAAKRTAAWLVEKSLDRGSRDNITILIVDVRVASKTNRKGARGMQLGDDDHLKGHNPAESVRGKGGENAASPSPKDPGSVDKGDDLPAPASRVLTSEGGGVAARRESESGLRGSEVVNVLGEHMEGVAARVPSLREDKTDLAGGGGVVGGEGRNGRGGVAGLLGGAVGGEGRSGRGGAEHNEGSLSTTSLPRRGFSHVPFSLDEPPPTKAATLNQSRMSREFQQQDLAQANDRNSNHGRELNAAVDHATSKGGPPSNAFKTSCCGCLGHRNHAS